MTLISSLNSAKQALQVNEAALSVVSNNIANVNTKGYSKLGVNLAPVVTALSAQSANNVYVVANSLSGVEISNIQRYSDTYLQNYYWGQNSTNSYYNEYSTIASNIEGVTNELEDSGLETAISNFYTAVNSLSSDPSDPTARENYISAAQTICSVFNSTSSSLSDIETNLVGNASSTDGSELSGEINQVNSILDQLAEVNKSIIQSGVTGTSNTGATASLLDQRDTLISSLSSYVNVNVNLSSNGVANVSLGNCALVSGKDVIGNLSASNSVDSKGNLVTTISIEDVNGKTTYPNVNDLITSGSIGSVLDATGTDSTKLNVSGTLATLNTLAQAFANIMNTIQTGDPNSDGSVPMSLNSDGTKIVKATNQLFVNSGATTTIVTPTSTTTTTTSTGITAANISINPAVLKNTNLIAAARLTQAQYTQYVADGTYSTSTGNNANVALMSASRTKIYNATYDSGGYETDLGNVTIEGYLANFVGSVSTKADNINTSATTQASVLASVQSKLSSETGVNLDEELTDMMKYQRAYEASARVFTTCSTLLGELIQLGT